MATVKLTEIKSLKLAAFNPTSRMTDISGLVASIKEVGLLVPVLATKNGEVVDGHRRIAAYKVMKLTEIPTITIDGDLPKMFAHANGTSRKLNGYETLSVYLKEPNAVGAKARNQLQEAEEKLGRRLLERMASEGLSVRSFQIAKKLCRLTDQESNSILQQIVKWLLHFKCTGVVSEALYTGMAPGMILAAVKRNKSIRPSYTVNK